MWTKGNGNNNTGWHSEEYERLLSEAANSADPAQRMRVFEKAEKLLMEERPILPFAWQARNYLHHPSVKGWNPLLLDNHPWKDISLEETD
jgi:oligopeptide transport system substrate-binding protein